MLQHALLRRSPRLLRWYRTQLTLDWPRLQRYIPMRGSVLDVGCGVGSLDHELGRSRRGLHLLGIDIDATNIKLAKTYHALPNVAFARRELASVQGQFDCILFVDVLHHVPPAEHLDLLRASERLLDENGYLLIKDIERDRGYASWLMDRYLSGCRDIYLHNCNELVETVNSVLDVSWSEVHFRAPFPHYYILAQRRGS
jgi:2-polyprenyl-6-hydroxyphenyl methylase/3-demethylubiquinone-9 3-methyltransferase